MIAENSNAERKVATATAATWSIWVLLALLPIGLLTLFAYQTASQSVRESYRASNVAAAVVGADFVRDDFQRRLGVTAYLAESQGFVQAVKERDEDAVRARLRSAVLLHPALDRAFVHDIEGVLWSDYPLAPESLNRSFVDAEWYAGVSEHWEPHVSAAYAGDAASRALAVAVAVPVRDEAGEAIGILVAQYRPDSVGEGLARVRLGETGAVILLDSHGHLVGHRDLDLEQHLYDEYAGVGAFRAALEGTISTREFSDPLTGELTVATFYPVHFNTGNWVIVARQTAAEAYAPIRKIAWNIGGAGGILALAAVAVVIGLWRASENNRRLNLKLARGTAALQEQTKRQRNLSAQLTSAEQRERKRLAALLHDDLQQLLVAANMRLNGVSRDGLDESAKQTLGEVGDWIERAIDSARDLTHELRPPALYEAGLVAALHWLASRIWERHHLRVAIDSEETLQPLRDDIKALLFDCVRELLFNVTKHAGVEHTTVRIFEDGDSFCVTVEDKGKGFDVGAQAKETDSGGFGLFSIGERLLALGANMTIDSRIDHGTCTKIAIPLAVAVAPEAMATGEQERSREPARSEGSLAGAGGFPTVRVLVVDDHALVRQGIANILRSDERISVVGEAADGIEAIEAMEQTSPEVVLMDVNMPRMNGVEATRAIHRLWPDKTIIGLSVQDDEATRNSMLDSGAREFLPKSGDAGRMIETIMTFANRKGIGGGELQKK